MGRYFIKRLAIAIATFFGITLLAYILTSMMPGSPIDFIVSSNPNMTADQVAALEKEMGIDQPVIIQYLSDRLLFVRLDSIAIYDNNTKLSRLYMIIAIYLCMLGRTYSV